MKKSKIWTKEQGFSVLIDESESRKQMEYNLARAQLGVLGYTAEEVWGRVLSSKVEEGDGRIGKKL